MSGQEDYIYPQRSSVQSWANQHLPLFPSKARDGSIPIVSSLSTMARSVSPLRGVGDEEVRREGNASPIGGAAASAGDASQGLGGLPREGSIPERVPPPPFGAPTGTGPLGAGGYGLASYNDPVGARVVENRLPRGCSAATWFPSASPMTERKMSKEQKAERSQRAITPQEEARPIFLAK